MTAGNAGPPDGSSDDGDGTDSSPSRPSASRLRTDESSGRDILSRFLHAQSGPLMVAREMLTSVGVVLLVGALLFAASGVWPPMVAVESGSMEPHMEKGDLVFISEPGRYTPSESYRDTGVVTYETGSDIGYRTFGDYGSVVVYDNPERYGPPVIHRARFWVEEGENWYDKANPEYVNANNCQELLNCPAPHAGFVTKGDANSFYDQANGISEPVRPSWVTGVGMFRIPYLGWVRLWLTNVAPVTPTSLSTDAPHVSTPPSPSVELEPVASAAAMEEADGTAACVAPQTGGERESRSDFRDTTPFSSGGTGSVTAV